MREFGLIGQSLSHSFSQKYFTQKFAREAIHAEYLLHELQQIDEFPSLLETRPSLCGLNVTIPYKSQVIPFLASLSPEAQAVGAVNTIRVEKDRLTGHNSDVYGFKLSLEEFLQGHHPSQALILGTGGAAKAVEYVLKTDLHIPYTYVSRNPSEGQFSYQELRQHDLDIYPLIINTTPLGMYPHIEAAPDIAYKQLGPQHYLYDLIYNPEQTFFMTQGKRQGAQVYNGLRMLHLQAERSWEIWNQS